MSGGRPNDGRHRPGIGRGDESQCSASFPATTYHDRSIYGIWTPAGHGAVVCCRIDNRRIRPGIWRLVVGWEAARLLGYNGFTLRQPFLRRPPACDDSPNNCILRDVAGRQDAIYDDHSTPRV